MATKNKEVAKPQKSIDAGPSRESQTVATVQQPLPESQEKPASCGFACTGFTALFAVTLWWFIRDSRKKISS